jgi:hypothetical protein
MRQTALWSVTLRAGSNYTWSGHFMCEPTPQDIRDAVKHELTSTTRASALLEIAESIPDYLELSDGVYALRMPLTHKSGSITVKSRWAYRP